MKCRIIEFKLYSVKTFGRCLSHIISSISSVSCFVELIGLAKKRLEYSCFQSYAKTFLLSICLQTHLFYVKLDRTNRVESRRVIACYSERRATEIYVAMHFNAVARPT